MNQVVKYFKSTADCKDFAQICQDRNINGAALFRLMIVFREGLEVKIDFAVTIMQHIRKLNSRGIILIIIIIIAH